MSDLTDPTGFEPLLGAQQYVAEWDPITDELLLTGTLPGPAGSFEMSLRGIAVVLDAADPAVVNTLVITDSTNLTDATRRLLQRLLGHDAAGTALSSIGDAAARSRIDGRRTQRGDDGVSPEMARLVLSMSTAGDAGLRAEERALATLEAAVLAHRLDLHEWIDGWADRLHDSASAVARAGPLDSTFGWSPGRPARGSSPDGRASGGAASVAAALCRAAAGLITDDLLRSRLLHLSEPDQPRHVAAAASAPAAAPLPAMAKRARPEQAPEPVSEQLPEAAVAYLPHALDRAVTADSLPRLLAGAEPTISRTSNDEYELRLPGWAGRADGWWVRACAGADRVPLAIAPMADDARDAVARFLVTEHAAAAMVVDIVDDPAELLATTQIATFRAAVAAGKRAGRLERLGRPDEAQLAWQEASDLHYTAGDNWRGETASAIATGRFQRSDGTRPMALEPVVADLVAPLA